MCITRPDWPANSLFFAFSRPLAEGCPSSAGRWPRLLIGEKILDSSQFSIVVLERLVTREVQYRNEFLHALLFVMSFLMLCNDYKPLQGVVSSGSKGGNQRTLGVVISGLSLV